ncbi:MAG TPA: polysaccharide pyruvyl transferase family protein [Thermoanaerobaculia bacterium]|nr:polysaccharide pyruvyl transferase family protein [Thermoanaerobaculia bacterium]
MTPPSPPRVLIAGSYGQGNTGDEAILAVLLSGLRSRFPDAHLQVVSGDVAGTRERHGVEPLYWGDWAPIAEALRRADLLILGGGGIFFDYWGFDARRLLEDGAPDLAHYASFPLLAWLFGKPLLIYACGAGPLFTEEGREAVRLAFSLAARASVRDTESKALLEQIGVAGAHVEVTADPAFALQPAGEERARSLMAAAGIAGGRPVVGVTPRPWDFGVSQESWETGLAEAVAAFARARGAQVLLIPFHAGYDDPALERLQAKLAAGGLAEEEVRSLGAGCTPEELAAVVGSCDLLVGLRLHSVLFAMLAGTPLVALAYDPKVRHLARLAGHEDVCLDLSGLGELGALLERVWQGREELRRDLLAAGQELKRAAGRNLELAVELLTSPPPQTPLSAADEEAVRRLAGHAVEGRLRDVAGRDAVIRERGAVIERQWEDMERYRSWLEQATEERRLSQEERTQEQKQDLALRQQEIHALHRQTREQRDLFLAERNDLERRLSAIEATLAYGLASRFWAAMRRLFPEGTVRRRVYRKVRGALGRRLPGGAPAPAASGSAPPVPGEPLPDPRSDLLQFEERARRAGAGMVVAIVSATQLVESEGQRPTQLALELAGRGIPVVFVYWRWWKTEWRPQDRVVDGIVQIPIDVVTERPEVLTGAFAGWSRILMVEFPHPSFFELLAAANAEGWTTVYDVLDDWEEFHRVGQAVWFDEAFERHLINAVDAVFTINETLTARIRELGGEEAQIVRNGLRTGIEAVREPRSLARGELTVGYFGYLAGAWFDWKLLAEAARLRPSWRFYLIGYGGSPEGMELTANVELLGKQPQSDLAAWAANWDVAVIPFKPDRLAAGADPIKTYEYLAMGLPVVCTGVYPPPGSEELVLRADGIDGFLAAIERAAALPGEAAAERRAFAAASTWAHRVDELLAALAKGEQRVGEKRALLGAASPAP